VLRVLMCLLPTVMLGAGSVSIKDNVTNGTSTIYIGDSFTLTITNGAPNSAVTYTQNGTGPFSIGSTDSSGHFTFTATAPSPATTLSQVWMVAGVAANPNPLVFTIANPPTPSVSIQDNVTFSTSTFYIGDSYTLRISGGKPNSPVTYTQSGAGPYSMGNTDGSGNYTLTGTAPAPASTWSQVWMVAGVAAYPNPLLFTVANKPTPSVSIKDNATNSTSVLYIGDPFTVTVTGGEPNSAVTYTENGTGPYSIGTTGSTGNFTFNAVSPSPAASFSQVWMVASVAGNPNPLNFTRAVGTPHITSVSPSTAAPGTSVTINGYAFQATQGSSSVTFNGTAATISSWTGTQIVALVPALAAGSVNIVVSVAGLQSTGMAFQVQATTNPLISNLSLSPGGTPSQSLTGPAQMGFVINGLNFGAAQGTSTVKIGNVALTVVSWTATAITVQVPAAAVTGNVVVTVNAKPPSNGLTFNVSNAFGCVIL